MEYWLYPSAKGRVPHPVVYTYERGEQIAIGPFATEPELRVWAGEHPNYHGAIMRDLTPDIKYIYRPWFLRILWDLEADGTNLTSDDIRLLCCLRLRLGLDAFQPQGERR